MDRIHDSPIESSRRRLCAHWCADTSEHRSSHLLQHSSVASAVVVDLSLLRVKVTRATWLFRMPCPDRTACMILTESAAFVHAYCFYGRHDIKVRNAGVS
eukprot:COSAG02_NODE_5055_length_4686_cov_9.954654_8_plen_100_part_00